jgi:hypothetical protein
MSEENTDNLQPDPGDSTGDETTDNPKETNDPSELAAKAGHKGLDDFIAAGGSADRYQSPEVFLALKGPLKSIKHQTRKLQEQEQRFNQQMESVKTFHKAQLESQKAQLMSQRDEAIGDLDADKAKAFQTQIDNLQQAPIQQAAPPAQSEIVATWSNDPKNAWIDKPGARSTYAQTQFQGYLSQNHDDTTALRLMEADMAREFPDVNIAARNAPHVEGGTPPGNKPSKSVTMQDLTTEEAAIWKHSAGMWGNDQKAFLTSVKNTRGA